MDVVGDGSFTYDKGLRLRPATNCGPMEVFKYTSWAVAAATLACPKVLWCLLTELRL